MKIYSNLKSIDLITTLDEWFQKSPPLGKEYHWVDGRSAKETAKHWLQNIPIEFLDILECFQLDFELCIPEHVSKLDNFRGNARNHDLLIIAKNKQSEKFIISIESKVDEKFGNTIEKSKINALKELKKNPRSNALYRIDNLLEAIFINPIKRHEVLRYQLLTAIAGTLTEAKQQGSKKAIFLVQTFVFNDMKSKQYYQNQLDFNYLIEIITEGRQNIIHNGDLVGPFTFHGNIHIPNDVELWIGKFEVNL